MAFETAGRYADFLPQDLIDFGQGKGSASFGNSSNKKYDDVLDKIFSLDYQQQILENKLKFDKEQMKAAYPYLLARELPGQVARAVNPMADPTTAAIVLSSFQRGQEGIENIVRGMPQLSQSGSQIGFVPSGRYFKELQG